MQLKSQNEENIYIYIYIYIFCSKMHAKFHDTIDEYRQKNILRKWSHRNFHDRVLALSYLTSTHKQKIKE
jgi:hypothetical protein